MLSRLARRTLQCRAPLSLNSQRNASGSPHYNEPTGWLFSEKVRLSRARSVTLGLSIVTRQPPPPGQKRQREDWELLWYGGMFGGMGLAAVLLYYKPDTR